MRYLDLRAKSQEGAKGIAVHQFERGLEISSLKYPESDKQGYALSYRAKALSGGEIALALGKRDDLVLMNSYSNSYFKVCRIDPGLIELMRQRQLIRYTMKIYPST